MPDVHLACVVGARPNFMKMAPLLRALESHPHCRTTLIHTGQHYDASLSDVFFRELEMRPPDVSLEVGSGKHGAQTAKIIERMEGVLENGPGNGVRFDRLIVVGDVNSTMGAAVAAAKLNIPVAHVEAGLRSLDRTMPEEINRIVTDAISDMLFVSEPAGRVHLLREGHSPDGIFVVGNVMIDTLLRLLPAAKNQDTLSRLGLDAGKYGVVTLHRPSNVDDADSLAGLTDVLLRSSRSFRLVFAVHPRTRQRLEQFGLWNRLDVASDLIVVPPLGYLDFLALTSQSAVVVTDSGGLQEECTALQIPCLTMRENTERPITVTEGTSKLIGQNFELLEQGLQHVREGRYKQGRCPDLWDGRASERIAHVLAGGNVE